MWPILWVWGALCTEIVIIGIVVYAVTIRENRREDLDNLNLEYRALCDRSDR